MRKKFGPQEVLRIPPVFRAFFIGARALVSAGKSPTQKSPLRKKTECCGDFCRRAACEEQGT